MHSFPQSWEPPAWGPLPEYDFLPPTVLGLVLPTVSCARGAWAQRECSAESWRVRRHMDEAAFQSKMAGSLCQAWIAQEAPSAGSPHLRNQMRPRLWERLRCLVASLASQDTWTTRAQVVCWREVGTATSFHVGHSPKTGGIFPTLLSWWAPSQAAAAFSSLCLIWLLYGLRRPDLPP